MYQTGDSTTIDMNSHSFFRALRHGEPAGRRDTTPDEDWVRHRRRHGLPLAPRPSESGSYNPRMPGQRPATSLATIAFVLATLPAFSQQAAPPAAEFVAALGRFSLALEGVSGTEGAAMLSALDAMQAALARWDAMIETYEAGLAAEIGGARPPLAARMHLAMGGVYLDRGRIADAVRELDAARTSDPSRADIQTLLGYAYSQGEGNPAAATEAFSRAAALTPEDPVRAYVLARHLAALGRLEESSRVLRTVAAAAPPGADGGPPPFVRLGLVPEAAGVDPFFPPAVYAEGFAHLQRGEYARAIAAFRAAAAADPMLSAEGAPYREALRRSAEAYRDGRFGDELDGLTAAVALAPRDERARLARVQALLEGGDLDAAQRALGETLAIVPEAGRAHYMLARLHQRRNEHADAIREFEAALARNPLVGRNGIYQTLGVLHAARQDLAAAVAAYSTRIDLHPNDAAAHYDLGDIYLRQGRDLEALAEFSVSRLLAPGEPKVHVALAQTHLRRAEYQQAADAARRALELQPDHHEARYVLGTALVRAGRVAEGRVELEAYRRREDALDEERRRSFELEGFRRQAALAAAAGKHAEAVALLRQAVALEASHVSHLELGLALLDAGEPAEAVEHLNAASRFEASYEIHRYLAAAYRALGRIADSEREQAAYLERRREAVRRQGGRR